MAHAGPSRDRDEDHDSRGDEKDALIARGPREPVELIVFLRDRAGIYFHLEDGHLIKADELLELVIQEQGLPPWAKEVFSLWFVSSILDVRLKRHHQPFQIIQQWDELCALYTDANNEEIRDSEPVLMVQRDVFYPLEQEVQITDEQTLCLLYHEAKYNVVQGRFALTPQDYHRLAGLQALIHLGKFSSQSHMLASYRSNLVMFYPESMYTKERFLFFARLRAQARDCEELFMQAHQEISEVFASLDVNSSLSTLYRRYLEVCWSYPFYGSAFFSGHVETPSSRLKKFILPTPDTPVHTAINIDGVSVIDRARSELLLSIPFSQLSWEFRDPDFDGDNDPPPCLFLQFLASQGPADGKDGEASNGKHGDLEGGSPVAPLTKLLKIYSREAKLMDALIETCVRRKLSRQGEGDPPGLDSVDSGPSFSTLARGVRNRLERLCLSTFTKDGELQTQ
ncbi:putative FERM domain-containing protein FRMD8P1 [Babylonia areolata]|uniref:putative FERM domain-containing protein FRMD8P1 n=1 Tax=Babylonia areolata TaxID=304850 RepID=UPI003FD1A513